MPDMEGKSTAILSYITFVGTFIAISMNSGDQKKQFASFHIRQALGIYTLAMASGFVVRQVSHWGIALAYWSFFSILLTFGFVTAIMGKTILIPVVGKLFQKIFKGL